MSRPKGLAKTGGRRKGQPNKAQQAVADRLDDLKCDPIEGMASIAKQAMAEKDFVLAGSMFKELAQYIAPKRKSVEISGSLSFEERLKQLSTEELQEEYDKVDIE